jgi:secernin
MDLVRLALERSRTARDAVELLGALVEQYGQFGSAVPTKPHDLGGYDNSFLVADPHESWVVEAVGRRWLARRFDHGTTSISNQLTIRAGWDLGSLDIADYAVEMGWWPADLKQGFDFARAYVDDCVPRQVSQLRLMRSRQLLAQQQGQITPKWMKRIARDHYEDSFLQGPYFDATDPDFHSLCMHSSAASFTWGNTASSCIAVLPRSESELPLFWWTPGPPCNGCYVPFFVHGSMLPEIVTTAGTFGKQVCAPHTAGEDTFAPQSYWWLFRELLDRVKGDPICSIPGLYPVRNRLVRERFDALEQEFEAQVPAVVREALAVDQSGLRAALLDDFTQCCVHKVHAMLKELLSTFSSS